MVKRDGRNNRIGRINRRGRFDADFPRRANAGSGRNRLERRNGHLYGYGEHPEDLRFNFRRETDYCSGASLLISKDLFDSLGGFDMRYAPAYYEDTDLCMSVRAVKSQSRFPAAFACDSF